MPTSSAGNRRLGRSILAVLAGLVFIFVTHLGTDQIMHALKIFPPWGEVIRSHGVLALALSYRVLWSIPACYLTARLAPHGPMGHALILGGIGTVLSLVGVIVALQVDLGPLWYPVAVAATALPCAWLGGVLHRRLHA